MKNNIDVPIHEITFVGKLRWKYRMKPFGFAIKALFMALCGYQLSTICRLKNEDK